MKIELPRLVRSLWSVYGLLLLVSLAYGLPLLSRPDYWGRCDWDQFSFRYATPQLAMLRDRQLPLWNPYVNGGNVLAAHPHSPAFSPWYLPTLLVGAPLWLRLQVILFVMLGATGMAALLRRWGVSAAGCFVGGVLLMMSAHFALHITEGHLEWTVLGLAPWVFWCLVKADDDWRWVIAAAALLASALLHGSIYVVLLFGPLLVLWAVLESIRQGRLRTAIHASAAVALSGLLSSVVLLPRAEFAGSHPRVTHQREQVAPAALAWMLLSPRQAEMYRATRDTRNPPVYELKRLLDPEFAVQTYQRQLQTWRRLDLTVETTSDWTFLDFTNVPYVLILTDPEKIKGTPEDVIREKYTPGGFGIHPKVPVKDRKPAKATVFLRLPEEGGIDMAVSRGDVGETRISISVDGHVIYQCRHDTRVLADPGGNRRVFTITRGLLLTGAVGRTDPTQDWFQMEVTVRSFSDWCDVMLPEVPYVFHVVAPGSPEEEKGHFSAQSLAMRNRDPGKSEVVRRAMLSFQCPDLDNLCVQVRAGSMARTTLEFRTPDGRLLPATRKDIESPKNDVVCKYYLPRTLIREQLEFNPLPWRWRLNDLGMTWDWHEYGCYITWLGLLAAGIGAVVSLRRHWPLLVIGAVAAISTLGAALPTDVWQLWKQLPLYGSLQVSSRSLAVLVFVAAACGGFGVDRMGRWLRRAGGPWSRIVPWVIGLAIYAELAVLGWTLFSGIFVCPPRHVPAQEQFSQRYAEDEVRYSAMYSAHYPYLTANAGVLREYENIAIPRGKVRIATDPDYRGEAWLETGRGAAEIIRWTMARVRVALNVETAGQLVLNQNYFSGWKAVRYGEDGKAEKLAAEKSPDGLVSVAVTPGDREVVFYYLPDSFLAGAALSIFTLGGCLGLLVVSRRPALRDASARCGAALLRWCHPLGRSRLLLVLFWAMTINLPFLACHPTWTVVSEPMARSLAVNLVLWIMPGLPLVGLMIARGWLAGFHLLWTIALSLLVLVAVLLGVHLVRLPITGGVVWNGVWIVTNLALAANGALGGPAGFGLRPRGRAWWLGVPVFAVAYMLFFHGATRVVPPMLDHDLEIQSTGHALLHRLEPRVIGDRRLLYDFAHPLLLNFCEAVSFLYVDRLGDLVRFDEATERTVDAEAGETIEPVVQEFCRLADNRLVRCPAALPNGASRHRIVGVEGGRYLVQPAVPEWGGSIHVRELEVQILYDDYWRAPCRLPTRTPNVFLAAATVAGLGCWIAGWTRGVWLALLVSAVYATSPEVFVRSSYGGYFAISMFGALQMMLAAEEWAKDRSRTARMTCMLIGALAALADHKLVLLPASMVLWQILGLQRAGIRERIMTAVGHPVVLGFVLGTAAFWLYGLVIAPREFWTDHVHTHLVDRAIHRNPLGYEGYPTAIGVWRELWQHTGYVLLPLGLVALAITCWVRGAALPAPVEGEAASIPRGWRGMPGLWAAWALTTASVFSLIDWRQTKHLMPIVMLSCLSSARWAALRQTGLILAGILLALLLVWNLDVLRCLAADFNAFPVTPAW